MTIMLIALNQELAKREKYTIFNIESIPIISRGIN